MQDTLIQKLQLSIEQDIWNYDDSNDLNILVSPLKDIVIEWTDAGYFEIKKDKIMFNDCVNGHTYTLRKNGSREDWKKFQDLFIEASETKSFRVDAPISREELLIEETSWEYTRIARPGGGVGQVADQHFMNTDLLVNFLNDIINPYHYIIKSAMNVASNNSKPADLVTGLHPPIIIPHISIKHALKDNQGYYFAKTFDSWEQTPEKVIIACILFGQLLIKNFGTRVPPEFLDDWTVRAFNKWSSLLWKE
jgi:hypothetical protein